MPRYSERTGLLQTYQAGPFELPHLYLQWGGLLPGEETWSCGVRLIRKGEGPHSGADVGTMLAGAYAAVAAFHGRAGSKISNYCSMQFVKLNEIGTNGQYTGQGTNEATGNVGGVGMEDRHPNQVAIVATLVTAASRGPASKGRFYIPMPAMVTDTLGLISTSDRDGLVTSLNTFRTALNALSPKYELGVCSRKAGAPAQRAVTGFKVGRVLDTQRRRRRSLLEAY